MRWFFAMILAFGLVACGDDDDDGQSCGCDGNLVDWEEIVLPPELVDGGVWALDASDTRTIGLAASTSGSWIFEQTPDGWVTVGDQPLPRTFDGSMRAESGATGIVVDAVIDGTGKVQVVGADTSPQRALIWSEGDPGWIVTEGSVPYGLQSVVALGEKEFVAAGVGETAILTATGSVYDAISFVPVSTGGDPGEKGLVDLAEYDGAVYGCGFGDGADGSPGQPQQIVMRYAGGEWTSFESPCPIGTCGFFVMRAIEASSAGLHVGGSIMLRPPDDPGAQLEEHAWLAIFSAQDEEWMDIVLPHDVQLQRVNDILAASDGTVYLACGSDESPAYLVSAAPGEEPVVEWSRSGVRLSALVETADGKILAAGLEPGDPVEMPVLLERAK